MTTSPRIYVACLADYNNGNLHGVWIDAAQDADAIFEEINAMLRASKYPNVLVKCPDCFEACDCSALPCLCALTSKCPTCKGEGKVPSAEEFAIHDHEGFEGIKVGEYTSIAEVAALAKCLDEEGEAFAAFYNNGSMVADDDADFMLDKFRDAYAGTYGSVADYAEEITRECHEIPDFLDFYVDWEKMGHDMELGGDIWTADGGEGVYIFRNC